MKTILSAMLTVILSGCSASSAPCDTDTDAGPPVCKFERVHCPAGYACNIASDVCEPCGDSGTCSDGW